MNDSIAFDTHRFIKRLTQTGFTVQQAEALADEQVNLLDSNLATKADLMNIKVEIEKVKVEIEKVKAEIEKVKSDLLKWMIGAMMAQVGVIVTLIKLL